MKLFFFVTEDWYFCSHRLALGVAAKEAGFDVTVVTQVADHGDQIREAGLRVIDFPISRGSLNPFAELDVVRRLAKIYRRERPDIVHHVALKPVLYGSMAAWLVGRKKVVNAIAGMGWAFSSSSGVAKALKPVIRGLLRWLLNHGEVIVQNHDDADLVRRLGVEHVNLIQGSGVDVDRFHPVERSHAPPVVMLVARMIWDKGVQEFVEAGRILRARGVDARFVLVGDPDTGNRAQVPQGVLRQWSKDGDVEWWGRRDDMPAVLEQAHIACLPSYREGMPKTLLEAAAAGLPIVTSDAPGCREVVIDGDNGLLVPVKDATRLADALQALIEDEPLRSRMGLRSRALAMERFTDEAIINATLSVYGKLGFNVERA
ncbi:glycosyltransferase involved in cell wall biosynthesis [Natronocella acetinitrilica]|uniref:Glycosyltransferase involved in cell wall biosynthesis n=1 Tax=Natronocella acetinitrilica TaxID=414046 RepID=A0AAE3KBS1_9GAMM|nr:glycosyltransferase family 4 protein [Natronocella acetinitrilica]MCP1673983.1 glycosyltransferase involved in cell wall biosynthesis [Natronocella acetinitrilica]